MRRYAAFKGRVLLFLVLFCAGLFMVSGGMAENNAAASESAAAKKAAPRNNVFTLIMANTDFVFFTIIGCSIVATTLIIQGFVKTRRDVMIPQATSNRLRELISARQFKELLEFTETDSSFVSKALNPALKRAPSFPSMKEAMETAIGEQTAEQFRKIEYLNIIGNLGPLLGLLGTVLGMIDAFNRLDAAGGNANPSELAGGISKALTHTLLGLALAIPCLAAFGVLRTMVDRLTVQGALIAEDLLLMIKPAEARPMAAPLARPVAMVPKPTPVPNPGSAPTQA